MNSIPPVKTCRKCGQSFPATTEYFYTKGKGLHARCKVCVRADIYARKKADPEKNRESQRKWREKYPEKVKANNRRWRENNLEYAKQKVNEYYRAHQEELKAYAREWRKANPDYGRDYYEANKERKTENYARWYETNKVHKLEQDRRRRIANPEKSKMAARRWRKNNREKVNEGVKKWRQKNPDKVRAMHRAWKEKNPDKAKLGHHRRRARLKNLTEHFTASDVRSQYQAQKGRCWHCGCKLNGEYEIDHLVPIAKGGSDAANNIVCSCRKCNREKSAKTMMEWKGRLF